MKQALDRQIEEAKELKELLQHVSNRYCVVSNTKSPKVREQSAKAVFDLILVSSFLFTYLNCQLEREER